jgi:sec-independent protein translocase protein TatA
MGFKGISPMSLLLILLIVLVLFGGKRLRSLGSDLGGALKGFRGAMRDADVEEEYKPPAVEQKGGTGSTTQHTADAERR